MSRPDDEHEREADRVADRVARIPGPPLQRACACGGQCPECRARRAGGGPEELRAGRVEPGARGEPAAPPVVHAALASPGRPLDPAVRAFMEPRFGRDFSGVRVHSGGAAEQSARELRAHAYTVGRDIVFGPGRFAPETHEGRRLLAHELTHVAQQSGADAPAAGTLRRQSAGGEPDWHPDFPGCTTAQSARLDHLLLLARALVIGSIGDLENELEPSPSGIITIARSALLRNFHTEDPKDIRTILSRFRKILEKLEMGPRNVRCMDDTKCDALCEGRGAPFACAGPGVPITVCSGVFDGTSDPFYVVVLIHEAAHQVGMPLHTYDPAHRRAVPSERQLALRSADSYANFAEDRALGGTGGYNFFRR